MCDFFARHKGVHRPHRASFEGAVALPKHLHVRLARVDVSVVLSHAPAERRERWNALRRGRFRRRCRLGDGRCHRRRRVAMAALPKHHVGDAGTRDMPCRTPGRNRCDLRHHTRPFRYRMDTVRRGHRRWLGGWGVRGAVRRRRMVSDGRGWWVRSCTCHRSYLVRFLLCLSKTTRANCIGPQHAASHPIHPMQNRARAAPPHGRVEARACAPSDEGTNKMPRYSSPCPIRTSTRTSHHSPTRRMVGCGSPVQTPPSTFPDVPVHTLDRSIPMKITVRTLDGEHHPLHVMRDDTVQRLKSNVHDAMGLHPTRQRLIFKCIVATKKLRDFATT